MELKCPNCGLNNDVHMCTVLKPDKTVDYRVYHCNMCGFDWDEEESSKEEPQPEVKKECYWCSHYKSALSPLASESSFVVGVRPIIGGPVKVIDPTFCPFCGDKLLKETKE